jgi:hypothetical protein
MTERVKLDLMRLNRMPITKDIRNIVLEFLFVAPNEKLIQYIKSCGTEFSMDYLSYKPNGVQSYKFQFHRLHEVTGKVISKEFTFCQYCGDYFDGGIKDIKGGTHANICYDDYCYSRKNNRMADARSSDKLLIKFLKMNLDEHHQHIIFVTNMTDSRPGLRFIPFESVNPIEPICYDFWSNFDIRT